LRHLVYKGLKKRFPKSKSPPKEYLDRVEQELSIIQSKGFTNYFLIVWDYVAFARQSGIRVGPGRGSAAGSLVGKLLDNLWLLYNLHNESLCSGNNGYRSHTTRFII